MDNITQLTQEQLILARSRLWSPELDKLLRRWKKQISRREQGHHEESRKNTTKSRLIGIPSIILTGIVTTGSISTYKDGNTTYNTTNTTLSYNSDSKTTETIRLVISIISAIAFIITLLKGFLNYDSEAESHKTASNNYGELFRELDQLLLVPGPVRGDPIETLRNIRRKYDDIIRNSPSLPKKFEVELSYEVIPSSNLRSNSIKKIDSPRPSQISNLLSNSTKDIKKLLNDENPKKLKEVVIHKDISSSDTLGKIDEIMAKQNNHDTSDDEEVCLAYDLDTVPSYNSTEVALAAAQLAGRRQSQIQNSLRKTLAFELQRLDSHTKLNSKISTKEDIKKPVKKKESKKEIKKLVKKEEPKKEKIKKPVKKEEPKKEEK